jgi:hypothetical protein
MMGVRRGRSLRAVLAGSLLFGGLTTVSLAAASTLTEGTAAAGTGWPFASSGTGPETYPTVPAVPSGVCFVEVTAIGGAGGGGSANGGSGGAGGSTYARIPVTPGEQLAVDVGGAGGNSVPGITGITGNGGNGGAGGGGGGGAESGGGGGASVVSYSGVPQVVAGGGGGGDRGNGGNGGGTDGNGDAGDDGNGGGGGTNNGYGGYATYDSATDANAGAGGGGNGSAGGGGGGGGADGGGVGETGGAGNGIGGAGGDSGGGGASYVVSTATSSTFNPTNTSGDGSVTITYDSSTDLCTQLQITTTSLPDGTVGQPYSFALQATGGNPPYTWWYAKGGDLPRGVHFSTAGVLSGTPKKAGNYSITFRVRDTQIAGHHVNKAHAALTVTITIT